MIGGISVALVFEEGADFGELVVAGRFHRKRMKSELCGGTGEETLTEVLQNLALHQILAESGAVDMGAIGFVANDESLGRHDLKDLEDGRVAGRPVFIESIVNLTHRGRLLLPKDLEEFEFSFGGTGDEGAVFHDEETLYEELRNCQRNSSYIHLPGDFRTS